MEYISKKGLKKLKKKLSILNLEKKKIINHISEALEKGDLSENYEFIAAKQAYELLLIKINNLKKTILNSKIFKKQKKNNKIYLYSKVTIKNIKDNKIKKYKIVSNSESNIFKNKISIKAPMSLSLIGKKVGDIIVLNLSNKTIKYKILKIE